MSYGERTRRPPESDWPKTVRSVLDLSGAQNLEGENRGFVGLAKGPTLFAATVLHHAGQALQMRIRQNHQNKGRSQQHGVLYETNKLGALDWENKQKKP